MISIIFDVFGHYKFTISSDFFNIIAIIVKLEKKLSTKNGLSRRKLSPPVLRRYFRFNGDKF